MNQIISVLFKSALSIDDICSCRTVTYHCDGMTDLLFDKFYIFSAVLREIFVVLDSSDLAFPTGKSLVYGLSLIKEVSYRGFYCNLSVDVIAEIYRELLV